MAVPSTQANLANNELVDLQVGSVRKLQDGSFAQAGTQAGDWGAAAISTATTTTVKTGAGQLGAILVLGGTLGAITVYDNTAASGTQIAPAFTPVAMTGSGPQVYVFNCSFQTGLTVVTGAATAMTVLYR